MFPRYNRPVDADLQDPSSPFMVEAALDTRTIASNADLFSLGIAAYSGSGCDVSLGHSIEQLAPKSVLRSEKQHQGIDS